MLFCICRYSCDKVNFAKLTNAYEAVFHHNTSKDTENVNLKEGVGLVVAPKDKK